MKYILGLLFFSNLALAAPYNPLPSAFIIGNSVPSVISGPGPALLTVGPSPSQFVIGTNDVLTSLTDSSGYFNLQTGAVIDTASSGASGGINIQTGDTNGSGSPGSGMVFLVSGSSVNGAPFSGDIFLSAGSVSTNGTSKAGDIYLSTGGGTNGVGTTYGRVILQTTIQTQHISGVITATVDAHAGSGASCTLGSASEMGGSVTLVTGAGSALGSQCSINFTATPWPSAPRCFLTPTNSAAADTTATNHGTFATTSTTALIVNFVAAPAATTFTWNYFCLEVIP